MISLTYLKLVLGKPVVRASTWEDVLENKIIPALRNVDVDQDGAVSVAELLSLVKRVIISACI